MTGGPTCRERYLEAQAGELFSLVNELGLELRHAQLVVVRLLLAAATRNELITYAEDCVEAWHGIRPATQADEFVLIVHDEAGHGG